MAEHALIVSFNLNSKHGCSTSEQEEIRKLCSQLEQAINSNSVGEYDGHEFGRDECKLYMYGPNVDALFAAVAPILRTFAISRGVSITKRYGEAGTGADEDHMEL